MARTDHLGGDLFAAPTRTHAKRARAQGIGRTSRLVTSPFAGVVTASVGD